MHLTAILTYWVIVGLWTVILIVTAVAYRRKAIKLRAVRLLLAIIAIDTVRNIIENLYFGTYFGAHYGLLPDSIIDVLGDPRLLIIPKIINVFAACSVFALLFCWLPRTIKVSNDTENDLHQAEQKFQLLVEGVTEYAIYLLDPSGRITSWNSGAQRIKGYAAAEVIGRHVEEFYTAEDRFANKPAEALETAARDGQYEVKAWRVRKDGSRFWANVVIDAILDDAGILIGFAKVTKDITESLRAEERLLQIAHFDQLTGLPNRVPLMRDLARILSAEPANAAVGMFDLDGFKDINDTFGHSIGDLVLAEIAVRARDFLAEKAQFYRLGGDEFVLVVPHCKDPLEAVRLADGLRRRFEEGIAVEQRLLFVGASAGLALAPTDSSDAEELLAYADLALYRAKRSGGRKYNLFVPTMRAEARAPAGTR